MAVITSGKTFANGEQLSASKLNQVITAATFNQADAVDGSTMTLVGGAMAVRDTGITTAKIADSNVTKAKIENVANMKVLGNTSGSATSPQEVAILDEDTMSSDSATSLATQQSIKAYVDSAPNFTPSSYSGGESVTLPNGLIMKMGLTASVSADSSLAVSFGSAFPNAVISVVLTKKVAIQTMGQGELTANSVSTSGFTISNGQDSAGQVFFQAIGH